MQKHIKYINKELGGNKGFSIKVLKIFVIVNLLFLTLVLVLISLNTSNVFFNIIPVVIGIVLLFLSLFLVFREKYNLGKYLVILVVPYFFTIISVVVKSEGFLLNIYTFLVPKFTGILFLMTPVIFFGLKNKKNMIIGFVLLLPCVLFFDYFHLKFGIDIYKLPVDSSFYYLFIGLVSTFYIFVLVSMLFVEKSNVLYKRHIDFQKLIIENEFEKIKELNEKLRFQSNLYKILEITSKNRPLMFILQDVLNEVLKLDVLKVENKGLIFLTNEKGELNIAAQKNVEGLLATCSTVKKGQCLCGKVLENKQNIFCNKVDHRHDIIPPGMKPHGHYVVPIKYKEEVLGVINFYIKAEQPKDTDVVKFIEVVAEILSRKIIAEKTKEQLKFKQIKIAEQEKRISATLNELNDSISYAQHLQKSLIPNQHTIKQFFDESCVFFKPKDKVSGDFYFAHQVEENLYFGVGDCTGHGIPGGFLAAMSIESVKYTVSRLKNVHPNVILDELRKIAKDRFLTNFGESRSDSMDAGLCVYNKNSGKLYFSGGFVNLIIVRDGDIFEYKGTKCPVGSYPVEFDFELHDVQLKKGDVLYLSSDGFPDQFGYETENALKPTKFKKKRFKDLLIKISHLPCDEQVKILNNTIVNWRKDIDQTDDITVFIAKHL